MGAYIIRRLLISIPVLLGITIIGFVALKMTPGDPLTASLNPEVLANLMARPEVLEAERKRLGFDQPIFPNQYLIWLGKVVQGDFGYSVTSQALDRLRGRVAPSPDPVPDGHRADHGGRDRDSRSASSPRSDSIRSWTMP